MKQRVPLILAVACLAAAGAVYAGGGPKVQICHIPPGNPENFHTITISEKAFSAHLAHGDLGESCDAACATLCDDDDVCTIDDTGDCEQLGCPIIPELVDCDDGNECTENSCDPIDGCVNTPLAGEFCDDGEFCTGNDTCDALGACEGDPIADCCLSDADCSQNPCDGAACDQSTNRCVEMPVVCDPPELCTISECAPDSGVCVHTDIVCPEGETCNPSTGECVATSNVLYGDLNQDSVFSQLDLDLLMNMIFWPPPILPQPGTLAFLVTDVNGDGVLDLDDLLLFMQHLDGDISVFPVETT